MASTITKDDALKAALWLVPIIFTAGGLLWQSGEVRAELVTLTADFDGHEKLEAHPVSAVQLEEHRAVLETLMVEQRAMRSAQTSQAIDIAAICQATGARCR
jgi:preprotein translocase subunit SecF